MSSVGVFALGGQSPAVGHGDVSQSPVPVQFVYKWTLQSQIVSCVDPVSWEVGAGGSPWPAFGIEWNLRARKDVLLVPCAVGGSSVLPAASLGPHWGPTGTLRQDLLNTVNAACAACQPQLLKEPDFLGVLWAEGEAAAAALRDGVISSPLEYSAAFADMAAWFRAHTYTSLPIYVIRTGGSWDPSFNWALRAISEEQERIAELDPYTKIATWEACLFARQQGMLSPDGLHYSQRGNNRLGMLAARGVQG